MSVVDTTYYCKTCNRTMDEGQFYLSKRLDKYPLNGKLPECKKCITRHVNNWDPKTYLWILEEIDVPYIEDEWNTLVERYCKDRSKVTGMTVLGRYLSKMKLKQFRDYSWDDTEKIKAEKEAHKRDVMARQGYSGEEIEAAIAAGTLPEKPEGWDETDEVVEEAPTVDMLEPAFFNDDLTEEDKKMLTIKWGKTYKPYEWVQLEKYYQEMMQSFDIQTPSHEDYLRLICKTSLKAHQLIDLGDIEGFQKMSKVYDALMKSAKFTAVQNKAESGEFVNAISELVLLCEKEGFMPRYYVSEPKDKVDETLNDLRGYTHTLITEEMNLGTLIEGALRKIQQEAEREEDEDIDDEDDISDVEGLLGDDDFEEHYKFLEEQAMEDEAMFKELLGGDA